MSTLPALALTDNGDVLDADTGAIIPADDPTAVPAAITTALDAYARARVKAEALAFRMADIREPYIKAMDEALEADTAYQELRAEAEAARLVVDQTHAALGAYFRDRRERVSLDTGGVLVTWPKPRETWSLDQPASWYAGDEAKRELREMFRAYEDGAGIAQCIIDWLNPTAKVGALPDVRITLRSGS